MTEIKQNDGNLPNMIEIIPETEKTKKVSFPHEIYRGVLITFDDKDDVYEVYYRSTYFIFIKNIKNNRNFRVVFCRKLTENNTYRYFYEIK